MCEMIDGYIVVDGDIDVAEMLLRLFWKNLTDWLSDGVSK